MNEIEKLKMEIKALREEIDSLKDYSKISFDMGEAIKARVIPLGSVTGELASGAPSTVFINEAGVGTVTAQAPLSGKIALTIGGATYIVPTV